MRYSNDYPIIIFLILSFLFIFFTNTFYNFEQSLIYGAADGETYMRIAEASPNFSSEKEPFHKAQRFIIPYSIGLITNIINLDEYFLFKFFTTSIFLIYLYLLLKIFEKLEVTKQFQFFLFSLIIFNPYILRYFLSLPTLINDLMFILSGTLLLFSLLEKKKIFFFISILLATISRQNVIFILFGLILSKLIFRRKFHITFLDLIIAIIIYYLTHSINNYYASSLGGENYAYNFNERFGILFFNYSLKDFLFFMVFPIFNFLPIILFPLFLKFDFNKLNFKNDIVTVFSILVSMQIIFIAYSAGPVITGKNIIRLINLSNPFLIFILIKFFKNKNQISYLNYFIIILFFTLWSAHPTYSKIEIFSNITKMF